jgi:hypothetical protein
MNPITRITPVTDEEATLMARPHTLADLAHQIAATPISASRGGPARSWARNRPRRLLLGVPLAAGLTAAALVVALGLPGAGDHGTGKLGVGTAYLVKHVDSALSAAEPGDIAQVTVTFGSATASGGRTIAEQWSYESQWRAVTYSRTGQPVYDEGLSAASVYTMINYPARTWVRQVEADRAGAPTPDAGCGQKVFYALSLLFYPQKPVFDSSVISLLAVPGALRTAVSCGTLTVAGHQRVDGIQAIELTSQPGNPIPETFWVSVSTYLPVRVVVGSAFGASVAPKTADITWLEPTVSNLATFTVPIPAGFSQVPPSQGFGFSPQYPGGSASP